MEENTFCVLKVLNESSKPLWKREIHRQIDDTIEKLPLKEAFSVQTVGRRVNDLFDNGLIHAVAIADKDTNRTLITAYELTEEGEHALTEAMDRFLKEHVRAYVAESLFEEETDITDSQEFIRHTLCDLYDVPYDAIADARMEEILFLLHSYYVDRTLVPSLEADGFDALIESVDEHSTELAETLAQRKTLLET